MLLTGQAYTSGQCGPKDKLMAKDYCDNASVIWKRHGQHKRKAKDFLQELSKTKGLHEHCCLVTIGGSNAVIRTRSAFAGNLPLVPIFAIFFVISEQLPWLSSDRESKHASADTGPDQTSLTRLTWVNINLFNINMFQGRISIYILISNTVNSIGHRMILAQGIIGYMYQYFFAMDK